MFCRSSSCTVCSEMSVFASSAGVEHHVRQLADVRLPHLVLRAVDGAGPPALRHADVSLHGGLRRPGHSAAVHLELRDHGAQSRLLREEEQPVPLAVLQGAGAKI